MQGSSSDGTESGSLSWIADHMDWVYESDETDPAIIFNGPPDSKNTAGLVGHDGEDAVSDAESVMRKMPVTADPGVLPSDEINPEGRIFFGGIWWDPSWAEDMDLYDDHEYWRCEDDAVLEEVNPEEEEDPEEVNPEEEEDPEEMNPEEEDLEGGNSVGDNKEESFTGSNITP